MHLSSPRAALLVLLVAALMLPALPAAAHNALRSSTPTDGASLADPPDEVVLVFDDDVIDLGTQVLVTGPAGPVETSVPEVVGDRVAVALPPDVPAGEYTVQWRVTSADGHPISGDLAFTSTATTTPSPPASSPSPSATETPTAGPTPTGVTPPAGTANDGSGLPAGVLVAGGAAVLAGLAGAGLALRRRGER